MQSWLSCRGQSKVQTAHCCIEKVKGITYCCYWYCLWANHNVCGTLVNVITYESPFVCRKRCMFWWWLILMLQVAQNQHLLTGGTGWSWTYRYSKSAVTSAHFNSLMCFGDRDTGSICYWIRNSCGTNLWSTGWIFCSWKLCIFIISGSHLACFVFTSALGPIARLKNYEWFLSLTWWK